MPTIPFSKKHGLRFKTGAKPSPRHMLAAATPHIVVAAPPAQSAIVPAKIDIWYNDTFGICVTSEECFAKACYQPEIFIDPEEAKRWAKDHGVLNGAGLTEVMDWMGQKGFKGAGSQLYNDGGYTSVDYNDENILRSAISQGPVKVAIPASCLPSGAGSVQGWYTLSARSGRTDHCVSICGYGPAGWLYQQLGVPLPAGLPADTQGYLVFTWGTIGFVTFKWIKAALDEAWLRNPTTIGVPPIAPPVPPVPPGPVKNPPITGVLSSSSKITGEVVLAITDPTTGTFTYIPKKVAGGYGLVKKPVA